MRPRLEGRDGACDVCLTLAAVSGVIEGARLQVGAEEIELVCEPSSDGVVVARGAIRLREVAPWWPSPYGERALYPVSARVRMTGGDVIVDLGRTGFRTIGLHLEDGAFGIVVNGTEIFCRGAVWTPTDVVSIQDSPAELAASLGAVKAAGMNMLRISGTMLYPSLALLDACDELGILLWHDFMFATLDYPTADESFMASVRAEAVQATGRLQLSPSLAILCGNTEGEQQVAMLGLDPKDARSSLFDEVLPSIAAAAVPGVPYISSTPSGGTLPFHVDAGVSHYYGVGAYLRPIHDARRSRVRFTAECLGFANVPSDAVIDDLMDGDVPTQHPRWKERVPRDSGTPWDFDDVRDHYLRELFGVDPAALRATDVQRYLELSRLASGEAMAGAMSEWRRTGSECRGALVWFLRDLWPGAGWGLLDARGRPKAAYYLLRRVLQPVAVLALDEGLNGLALHVINDTPRPLDAELRLDLYRHGEVRVGEGVTAVNVPPRAGVIVSGDALLARFADTTYAYKFGPPGLDLALATLRDAATGKLLSRAFHFPAGRPLERRPDLGLEASAVPSEGGGWSVTVRSRRLAYAVALDAPGFVADDDFFHVPPGGEIAVSLRSVQPSARPFSARMLPVNAVAPSKVVPLDRPGSKRVDLPEASHG
jgi:beta-mannosidase